MSAVVQFQPSRLPANKPITLAMRITLRMAAAGALLRGADHMWSCRALPEEKARDVTVRGLAERGMLRIESYRGLYDTKREAAVITPKGAAALSDRTLASAAPPPVGPEIILREIEDALVVLSRDSEAMRKDILRDSTTARDARRMLASLEAGIAATERSLLAREAARERLETRRVDLRALVARACERLGEEMAEARS